MSTHIQTYGQAYLSQKFRLNSMVSNLLAVTLGVCLMSVLAQISIHLPFTPVPITGQTFGVTLTALLWGRRRALAVFSTYLAIGFLGLPVFAVATSSASIGYLVGMFFATIVMGTLADLGWAKKFHLALASSFIGSAIVFACGLVGLSFFVPHPQLLAMGLVPFLFGDFLKDLVASQIAFQLARSQK